MHITLPDWAAGVPLDQVVPDDEARMRLVIDLSRENIRRGTGGPFAAAIFEAGTGRLVSIGPNLVLHLQSSVMHGEVVAIILAQERVGSFRLSVPGQPRHELFTSCEPCAMCLGAVLWSGVSRLVCGAHRDDAQAIGFDEGPVGAASYAHLERAGIAVVRELLRADARAVLQEYARNDGIIYNGPG